MARGNTSLSERVKVKLSRERLLDLERQIKNRVDEASVIASMAQTKALAEEKGAEFDQAPQKRGEQRKPMRRLSGLGWLLAKGKITEDAYQAGLRYGEAYQRVMTDAPIRSILDRDPSASGGCTVAQLLASSEAYVYAAEKLQMYRGMMANHRALVDACDAICGREQTPREVSINGVAAQVVEALVIVALALMRQHLAPARKAVAPDIAVAA